MSVFATVADVEARLTYATISASSQPSIAQVQQWLDEGEAFLSGALRAAGLSTTYASGSDAEQILTSWATDYAEGHVRRAYASADGTGANEDGQELLIRFDETLTRIRTNPIGVGSELDATGDVADAVQNVKSHVTDNQDSKSISGGDFTPKITINEIF